MSIDRHVCAPSTSIREALRRIDAASPHLFQVVVDDERRVVGTVTDGDVRRAMLRSVGLDDPVSQCMNDQPVVGRPEAPSNGARLRASHFLPVVDESGRLMEVLLEGERQPSIARALVMAGGFGRRLGQETRDRPKPLLDVAGRPVLDRVLAQLEDAGVGRIDVSVHYLAEQIEAFLAARNSRAEVCVIRESEPLGTAGALGHLSQPQSGNILVVNGDVLTRANFGALAEFHDRHGHDATVGAAVHEVHVPFGVLRHGEDGLLDHIEEKPTYQHLVAAGIYYLSDAVLAFMPADPPVDMPELLDNAKRAGLCIGLFPVHEYWQDVGQPQDLRAARSHHDGDGPSS